MKFIKTIETLATKADKKGFARINGYYYDDLGRTEKYSVTVDGNLAELRHWGTTTAKVDTTTGKIKYLYGQSSSDADSISTFLEHYHANSQASVTTQDGLLGSFTYEPIKVFLGFYTSKERFHIDVMEQGGSGKVDHQILLNFDGVELNI